MKSLLRTERLVLRPFEVPDAPWLAAAVSNIEVARWLPLLPYPYTLADAEAFIALQTGPKADALAVIADGIGVGCITTATELGYWFAQDAWGKGFATEASRTIVARHFNAGHDRLESGYILDNNRSSNVLKKLGFTDTERVTRQSIAQNAAVTVQRMVLPRATWEAT